MSARFEELDWQRTPLGELSLRRWFNAASGDDIFEVKLGEAFLMSSRFTVAEEALADLALARLDGEDLDVVVGGLGLGYTAAAVLRDPRVRSLRVVEALDAVIGWHRRELLPVSQQLMSDPRCSFVDGDFFSLVANGEAFGPGAPAAYDAILVDIDHTPRHQLDASHASFYEPDGQRRVADLLTPAGVYALWSDDPPDEVYLTVMRAVFANTTAQVVPFANPITGGTSSNTVYLGTRDR